MDGFVGEAFLDDAGGPEAKGGLDAALAFDVAEVEVLARATKQRVWSGRILLHPASCHG